MPRMAFDSILIVGCGNMAGAMLEGWTLGSAGRGRRFTVVDPAAPKVPRGVRLESEIPRKDRFDAILLGIKPQLLAEVAPQVVRLAGPDTVVISILAGVEIAVLARHFPDAGGILRVMPNLAAALRQSPMALAERGLGAQGRKAAIDLLEPLGTPEWIDEAEFDVVTALAGSGPAFVYRFIAALTAAAEELGLPERKARRLALTTVKGAAMIADSSQAGPGELARRVTSPGGTTQAGLEVLDEDDALRVLLLKTLRAARDRSAELAAAARREG
jgi:pyrroline-5-carboxylate reductase